MNIGALTASLGIDAAGLNRAAAKMNEFQRTVDASAKKINASLKSTGAAMKKLGKSATMNLTVPMALAATAAVKLFSDYEASISKVVGLVGVASEQTDKWAKDILKLAPKVAKAPAELADALFFVTSAGIRGAEAMEVLEISAKASAAGLGETKTVADLVTSAMNAYGKDVLAAAEATDILVTTVREGKAEAADLAAVMGFVLPVASSMGVAFGEVGAAMAGMTRTGTPAAVAATQLRQILNSLLAPSNAAEDALIGMKTSSAELRQTIKEDGLLKALMDIKKLIGEDAAAMAQVFPNIRALSGVLDLMGNNMADNVKIWGAFKDVTGATDRALVAAAKTFKFQFNQTVVAGKVALTVLGMSIASTLLPLLQKLTGWLTSLAGWFSKLTESQKKWVLGIGATVAAAGPLLTILGFLVGNVLPGLITVTVAAAKAFTFLKLAIISNPIGLLIVALTTVIALFLTFRKKAIGAAEGQKELNSEMERFKDISEGISPISSQISNIGKLNERQLNELKQSITTQLNLNEDYALQLNKTDEEIIANDKVIKGRLLNAQKKNNASYTALQNEFIEERKITLKNLHLEEINSNQERLQTLQNYLKQVDLVLKNLSKDPKIPKISPLITEALHLFATGQERIINLQQAFGDSFDTVAPKIALNEEAIVSLIDAGVDPLSTSIQTLAKELNFLKTLAIVKDLKFPEIKTPEVPDFEVFPTESLDIILIGLPKLEDQLTRLQSVQKFAINPESWKKYQKQIEATSAEIANFKGETEDLLQTLGETAFTTADAFSALGSAISSASQDGKVTFAEAMNVISQSALSAISILGALAAAGMIAAESSKGLIGIITAVAGLAALAGLWASFVKPKPATGLAEGGIIPSGYPNDSFNAMLSSNEAVIPLDRLPQLLGMNKGSKGEQNVRFIIKGRDLEGILVSQNNLNRAY